MRFSDTEWTVMTAVWGGSPESVTAREVHERVAPETGWSYSTVRTLLTRLVEKRALDGTRDGKAVRYRARVSADQARRSALRSLVDRAFGGRMSALVQHLADAEPLDEAERKELESMLRAAEAEEEPT